LLTTFYVFLNDLSKKRKKSCFFLKSEKKRKIRILEHCWLVFGWMTVCGQVNHFGTKPASYRWTQAFYRPWDGKVSISFRAK